MPKVLVAVEVFDAITADDELLDGDEAVVWLATKDEAR